MANQREFLFVPEDNMIRLQQDESVSADNETNVAERQALCAIFMALSKSKQWNSVLNVKAIYFNTRLNN